MLKSKVDEQMARSKASVSKARGVTENEESQPNRFKENWFKTYFVGDPREATPRFPSNKDVVALSDAANDSTLAVRSVSDNSLPDETPTVREVSKESQISEETIESSESVEMPS